MLWFGWFGFNAGSAGGASPQAVSAFVVTQVAAAAAGLAWSLIEWIMHGRPTMPWNDHGCSCRFGCNHSSGWFSLKSVLHWLSDRLLRSSATYSSLSSSHSLVTTTLWDVFGVHGIGGIWGALATGIFANVGFGVNRAGGLIHGNPEQLWWLQVKAVGATCIYSAVATFVILKLVQLIIGLRTSDEGERMGLDVTDHAVPA